MPIPQLAVPPLPAGLPGYTVRVPTADDIDALYALGCAVDVSVIGTPMITRAEVEAGFSTESALADVRQALVERDGRAVCLPWIVQVHTDHLATDLQIDPGVPAGDRALLLAWAFDWFDRIAAANLAEPGVERVQVGSWCYEQDSARGDELTGIGFEQSRAFIRMVRALAPAETFPLPRPGIVVRPAVVDLDDPAGSEATLVHSIISTAFVDHFNFTATEFDVWFRRRRDDPGFDPALWFVAELDGRPLGAMLMSRELEQEQHAGFVSHVGTLREGRGHGLAKALLYQGFEANRRDGLTGTKLFVDAESPTGATALYESVGMAREHVILDWQRWLSSESR